MLQEEHSALLSIFIELPFVIKIFVLSIFEWLLKTGFTVDRLIQVQSAYKAGPPAKRHLNGFQACAKSCADPEGGAPLKNHKI